MSTDDVQYASVEPTHEGDCPLRDDLACQALGVTVVEPDPGWATDSHDHGHDDQEEVYLVLEGAVSLDVADETRRLEAGEAVRLAPTVTRRLHDPSEDALLVLASAARDRDVWNLDGVQG